MSEPVKHSRENINWERVGKIALGIAVQVTIAFLSGAAMAAGQSVVSGTKGNTLDGMFIKE